MAATNPLSSSSFKSEIQIIGAKNVETKHKGKLFVRCYLPAGNNRKITLNTKEIIKSSKKDDYVFWDDSFSLDCNGTHDSINKLKQEIIVFELRWKNSKTNHFLGKNGKSHLLARAEVPWKSVFEAPNMEIQTWVSLKVLNQADNNGGHMVEEVIVKPMALQIAIKVEIQSMEDMKKIRRRERLKRWDECGCKSNGCCSCVDNELLFVAATFGEW